MEREKLAETRRGCLMGALPMPGEQSCLGRSTAWMLVAESSGGPGRTWLLPPRSPGTPLPLPFLTPPVFLYQSAGLTPLLSFPAFSLASLNPEWLPSAAGPRGYAWKPESSTSRSENTDNDYIQLFTQQGCLFQFSFLKQLM